MYSVCSMYKVCTLCNDISRWYCYQGDGVMKSFVFPTRYEFLSIVFNKYSFLSLITAKIIGLI